MPASITDFSSHHELLAYVQAGGKARYLAFWGHTPARADQVCKSCLSQWHDSPFSADGVYYRTAEHYMMAGKARLFADTETLAQILAATTPAQAKALGREVRHFDSVLWEQQRFAIVTAGNLARFQAHPPLAAFLLGTGDRVLVEASPVDRIWGIGWAADQPAVQNPAHWRGLNLLGFALMQVRKALRSEQTA